MSSTKIQWRLQTRASRTHAWKNRGLYETRAVARSEAAYLREGRSSCGKILTHTGYGFGNTRVVRYVRGEK